MKIMYIGAFSGCVNHKHGIEAERGEAIEVDDKVAKELIDTGEWKEATMSSPMPTSATNEEDE